MKIKIYIVTYKGSQKVDNNLTSLFNSDLSLIDDLEVNIINNHSDFTLEDEFKDKVNVLHNVLRPDFSNGHLARNYNQAIINGFKDLNNPDCDILIHVQDDTIWKKDWVKQLLKAHETYTFIQQGLGDNFCSYLPEAVKKIGLWDERFNSITMHGADYFTCAVLYNNDKTSITDPGHKRNHNPMPNLNLISRPHTIKNWSQEHKDYGCEYFDHKWGTNGNDAFNMAKQGELVCLIESYIIYPYFEKDIEKLEWKGYFV